MLKDLLPLLRKGDTLGLSIAMEGENQYRINVLPKLFTTDGEKGEDRLALNQPLTITGTAEELDSPAFADTLKRYTASGQMLRHTIDEVEASQAAAAEQKKSAKKSGDKPDTKKPVKTDKAAAEPEAEEDAPLV